MKGVREIAPNLFRPREMSGRQGASFKAPWQRLVGRRLAGRLTGIPSFNPGVLLGFSSRSREVEAPHFVAFATPAPSSALPSD